MGKCARVQWEDKLHVIIYFNMENLCFFFLFLLFLERPIKISHTTLIFQTFALIFNLKKKNTKFTHH